jgi:hypothetical protein
VTPSVSNADPPLDNLENQDISAHSAGDLPPRLPPAAETDPQQRLADLAAALLALSSEDCDRLAALLRQGTREQSEGNAP